MGGSTKRVTEPRICRENSQNGTALSSIKVLLQQFTAICSPTRGFDFNVSSLKMTRFVKTFEIRMSANSVIELKRCHKDTTGVHGDRSRLEYVQEK
jgi:hypothetical protein